MKDSNSVVFVGVPLTQDINTPSSTTEKSDSCGCGYSHGLLAFIVGAILAAIGWVANQGWSIVTLMLFGPLTAWTVAAAWKHIFLMVVGAFCTSVACE